MEDKLKFQFILLPGDKLEITGAVPAKTDNTAENFLKNEKIYGLRINNPINSVPDLRILPQYEYNGKLCDVVAISKNCFENVLDVERIYIPATVRRINWNGINRKKLREFIVDPNNDVFESIDGVLYTKDGYDNKGSNEPGVKELIAYPSAKGEEYAVVDGTTNIGNQSFKDTDIKLLTLPKSIKEIGINAFYLCNKLESITMPSNLDYTDLKGFVMKYDEEHDTITYTNQEINY